MMNKILPLIFLLFFVLLPQARSQYQVKGTVISEEDGLGMPGVNVMKKKSQYGTITDIEGVFSLTLQDSSATLVFSFVGRETVEFTWNGEDSIKIVMKEDTSASFTTCFFHARRFAISGLSGLIHTPFGAQVDADIPMYFGPGTLVANASIQTNLKENSFIQTGLEYKGFTWINGMGMDANWDFRKLNFGQEFNAMAHSLETDLNFDRINLTAGLSHLTFNELNDQGRQSLPGAVVGLATVFRLPFWTQIAGKAAFYNGKTEYHAQITSQIKYSRNLRYLDVFVKYYQLDTFNELSVGLGHSFYY